MNRGSIVLTQSFLEILFGFNEAPIHESGKRVRPKTPDSNVPRFNEAPIHESGKLENR